MSRRAIFYLAAVILFVVAVVLLMVFRWGGDEEIVQWGRGELKISERAYYQNKFARIIDNWKQTMREAKHDREGRITGAYNVYLVMDTSVPAVWIETDCEVDAANYVELPGRVEWKVYRCWGGRNEELAGQVRLKMRGFNTRQHYPEMIYFVGEAKGLGHISFDFNSSAFGSGSSSGRFGMPSYGKEVVDARDYYDSIVVSDEEYERYRQRIDANGSVGKERGDGSAVPENMARWLGVERRLYKRIEEEVMRQGLALKHLEVVVGADYTGAHAELTGYRDSAIQKFFGGYRRREAYLQIDYVGEDVWYVISASHPRFPRTQRGGPLELEFVVCASGEIPRSEQKQWLEKGRRLVQGVMRPESKWKVTLANGATVEFIGVCESPSVGKQWWGPDGSPLGYETYCRRETVLRQRKNRAVFEIAYKISRAPGGGGMRGSMEGSRGSGYHRILDKYGNSIDDLHAEAYAFDKGREKTTLRLELRVGDGEWEKVEFRNISLMRGEDKGFEIKTGE